MSRKRVAFIGTGGTISSLGNGPLDTVNYGAMGNMLQADGILERFPDVQRVAEVVAVPYRNVPSPQIAWAEWRQLVLLCDTVVREDPSIAGIVIGHGTASLEETAYFLSLTLKVPVPVVMVGSQRPASALSTDAGLNLVNAVRVAADEGARGLGAVVVLNDEIQAAREVTKTSTGRMQTFRSPDFGVLGQADGDKVVWYRRPLRRLAPETEFDIRGLEALPRVDIAYSYAGADGTAVRAFTAAGAKGIVVAGFAPGFVTPGDAAALAEARGAGVIVLQSTRSGSGRVFPTTKLAEAGFIPADNLNPQKARILLALALTISSEPAEIERIFAVY